MFTLPCFFLPTFTFSNNFLDHMYSPLFRELFARKRRVSLTIPRQQFQMELRNPKNREAKIKNLADLLLRAAEPDYE